MKFFCFSLHHSSASLEFITLPTQPQLMNTLSYSTTRLRTTLIRFPLPSVTTSSTPFNLFAATSSYSSTTTTTLDHHPISVIVPELITPLPQKTKKNTTKPKASKVISEALLKENWLNSLSSPSPTTCSEEKISLGSDWLIGIDPDTSGALALLKPEGSVEVFDSPHLKVLVGKRERRRLDPKSIVQLIQSFDAPIGTTAYIEQSLPFPQDGKLGWWSGGFAYGLWIGILVSSGISVVPVPSFVWKNKFKLSGSRTSKDDSRELASTLFPSMSSMLKRKKDHGRAEALLIAAYGRDLRMKSDSSSIVGNNMS